MYISEPQTVINSACPSATATTGDRMWTRLPSCRREAAGWSRSFTLLACGSSPHRCKRSESICSHLPHKAAGEDTQETLEKTRCWEMQGEVADRRPRPREVEEAGKPLEGGEALLGSWGWTRGRGRPERKLWTWGMKQPPAVRLPSAWPLGGAEPERRERLLRWGHLPEDAGLA